MLQDGTLAKAKQYLDKHFPGTPVSGPGFKFETHPAVTLSRETGTGADRICELVIRRLSDAGLVFTYFDKNLLNKILETSGLPERFAEYLSEDRPHPIMEMVNEMLGIHPPTGALLRKLNEAILSLAMQGNVILVGRGSTLITSKLSNVLHFRLTAPLEMRINNMMLYYQMAEKDAAAFIKREDAARIDCVKTHFHRDLADINLYHAVFNLGKITPDQTACMIASAVQQLANEIVSK